MRVPPDARSGNPRLSRPRAYLRLLRTPKQNAWYGDLDPRSWRVAVHQARTQQMTAADLRRALEVVRSARAGGRALCSMPRSGTNWVFATVSCGLSLSRGGTGAFRIVPDRGVSGDDEWVFDGPKFGWPAQPQLLALSVVRDRAHEVGDPLFTFSHEPLEPGLIDYRRSRPVITVRDPLAVARSQVRKEGIDWHRAGPTRLHHSVARVPRFFSIWEQRLADPEVARRSLVLRYEDLRADPVTALSALGRHWDLGVDEATWERAAAMCSWQEMAAVAAERPGTARITLDAPELPDDIDAAIRAQIDGAGAAFGYPAAGERGA